MADDDRGARIEAAKELVRAEVFLDSVAGEGISKRVRIVQGPMTDVEGILVRTKPGKGLLVVSVELLRRSVAVEIDCTLVRPV